MLIYPQHTFQFSHQCFIVLKSKYYIHAKCQLLKGKQTVGSFSQLYLLLTSNQTVLDQGHPCLGQLMLTVRRKNYTVGVKGLQESILWTLQTFFFTLCLPITPYLLRIKNEMITINHNKRHMQRGLQEFVFLQSHTNRSNCCRILFIYVTIKLPLVLLFYIIVNIGTFLQLESGVLTVSPLSPDITFILGNTAPSVQC